VKRLESPLYSLILPTYNAGAIAHRTWAEVQRLLDSTSRRWEVLFVCDGCRDGSDQTLLDLAKKSGKNVRVLRSPSNRGKGHAVRRGLLRAHGDYRIFTDVDLAYPLDMVESAADQLAAGHDVVIACRAHTESEVLHSAGMENYLRKRKLQSSLFSNIARTLLHISYRDPQAGLKGLSAAAVTTMLPHIRCQGFGFDCELLVACRYFGIPVHEMPVRVIYDNVQSTTTLRSSLSMIGELMRIRRRWKHIARHGLDKSILITASDVGAARRYHLRRQQRLQQRLLQRELARS